MSIINRKSFSKRRERALKLLCDRVVADFRFEQFNGSMNGLNERGRDGTIVSALDTLGNRVAALYRARLDSVGEPIQEDE